MSAMRRGHNEVSSPPGGQFVALIHLLDRWRPLAKLVHNCIGVWITCD